MQQAINAVTLVEIRKKLEEIDRQMDEGELSETRFAALRDSYARWEALVDPVLHGQLVTERPA